MGEGEGGRRVGSVDSAETKEMMRNGRVVRGRWEGAEVWKSGLGGVGLIPD